MEKTVNIIGGGLAGSEAAMQLASRGVRVRLLEMRPAKPRPGDKTAARDELVCWNWTRSVKEDKRAGVLK